MKITPTFYKLATIATVFAAAVLSFCGTACDLNPLPPKCGELRQLDIRHSFEYEQPDVGAAQAAKRSVALHTYTCVDPILVCTTIADERTCTQVLPNAAISLVGCESHFTYEGYMTDKLCPYGKTVDATDWCVQVFAGNDDPDVDEPQHEFCLEDSPALPWLCESGECTQTLSPVPYEELLQ